MGTMISTTTGYGFVIDSGKSYELDEKVVEAYEQWYLEKLDSETDEYPPEGFSEWLEMELEKKYPLLSYDVSYYHDYGSGEYLIMVKSTMQTEYGVGFQKRDEQGHFIGNRDGAAVAQLYTFAIELGIENPDLDWYTGVSIG